jgi:hypothetical protein
MLLLRPRGQRASAGPGVRSSSVARAWVAACVAGEAVGIGTAALVARTASPSGRTPSVLVALAAGAVTGLAEGGALGMLQWRVVRVRFRTLPASGWVGVTAAAAVLGWVLGSLPAAASGDAGGAPSLPVTLILGAAMGAGMGVFFGAAQWLVLRRHADSAGRWVAANAAGWTAAMPLIFLGATSPNADTPLVVVGMTGVASGAAAGLALGVLTARWLVRLRPRPSSPHGRPEPANAKEPRTIPR